MLFQVDVEYLTIFTLRTIKNMHTQYMRYVQKFILSRGKSTWRLLRRLLECEKHDSDFIKTIIKDGFMVSCFIIEHENKNPTRVHYTSML